MSDYRKLLNGALGLSVAFNASLSSGAIVTAATREEEDAAKVAEWERHPVVTICEDPEGRQFIISRTESPPDAPPGLEPITILFRLSGDTCGQAPANQSSDSEDE
ncbi:MAG TPA: hypothetical protein VL966_05760 [Alphaproteobacteria bacterium]|jgi:hypothetical protein|nr:hypothetical protein [Alphaproteobacteria bacterium]